MEKSISFLKKLKNNNNKDWFEKNKGVYLKAKEEFETYIDGILDEIRKFDKLISTDLKGKNCSFRIYKDVRFSKDKTPYKTNMGASMNPGGKKSLIAGYYLHLEPGASFVAGGVYMPEPILLQAIRQEIDYNPKPLQKILQSPAFKKYFKGFDEADKLKTAPKGFDKESPQLELLKNKHFVVSYYIDDKTILDKKGKTTVVGAFKAMKELLDYLRQVNH